MVHNGVRNGKRSNQYCVFSAELPVPASPSAAEDGAQHLQGSDNNDDDGRTSQKEAGSWTCRKLKDTPDTDPQLEESSTRLCFSSQPRWRCEEARTSRSRTKPESPPSPADPVPSRLRWSRWWCAIDGRCCSRQILGGPVKVMMVIESLGVVGAARLRRFLLCGEVERIQAPHLPDADWFTRLSIKVLPKTVSFYFYMKYFLLYFFLLFTIKFIIICLWCVFPLLSLFCWRRANARAPPPWLWLVSALVNQEASLNSIIYFLY